MKESDNEYRKHLEEIEKAASNYVDTEMKPKTISEGRIGVQSFVAGFQLAEGLAYEKQRGR